MVNTNDGLCRMTEAYLGSTKTQSLAPPKTVKQVLDTAIQESRQRTEALCVNKAKLETLGLLEMPHESLTHLLSTWPSLSEVT